MSALRNFPHGGLGFAILAIAAVVGVVILFSFMASQSRASAIGVDVTLEFKNGTKKTFQAKWTALSTQESSVYDFSTGSRSTELIAVKFTPWVKVNYEGTPARFEVTGTGTVGIKPYLEPVANKQTFNVQRDVQKSGTTIPKSGEVIYLNEVGVTSVDIEKWSASDGQYDVILSVTVVATVADAYGSSAQVKQGTGTGSLKVDVNHSSSLLPLRILGISVGATAEIMSSF